MAIRTATMSSTLNPNAPLFIPAAFIAAEDFSPEWWRLVHTSPAFRDYWLRESADTYVLEDEDEFHTIDDDLLDIQNQIYSDYGLEDSAHQHKQGNGLSGDVNEEAVSAFMGFDSNSTKSQRMWREPPKYHEKAPNKALKSPHKISMHRALKDSNDGALTHQTCAASCRF